MTEKDKSIYLDLFDMARRNMRRNGQIMRFGRDLVLYQIPDEHGIFDADEMTALSCHDFIFACYMRLLGRLPEKAIISYPTPRDVVPPGRDEEFVRHVLPEFTNSLEYREYHAIEDPPPPPPPPPPPQPPPPPPPRFINARLWYGLRAALKPLTPFFLRKFLNRAVHHD